MSLVSLAKFDHAGGRVPDKVLYSRVSIFRLAKFDHDAGKVPDK